MLSTRKLSKMKFIKLKWYFFPFFSVCMQTFYLFFCFSSFSNFTLLLFYCFFVLFFFHLLCFWYLIAGSKNIKWMRRIFRWRERIYRGYMSSRILVGENYVKNNKKIIFKRRKRENFPMKVLINDEKVNSIVRRWKPINHHN